MKRNLLYLLLVAAFMAPSLAGAVTPEDFKIDTAQDLVDVCSTPPSDPSYVAAINFCQGYMVGAFDYHVASNAGPEGKLLVCLPKPPPTRNEAIAMFLEWAKAHPQYMSEEAVDAEFRFLTEMWPCK